MGSRRRRGPVGPGRPRRGKGAMGVRPPSVRHEASSAPPAAPLPGACGISPSGSASWGPRGRGAPSSGPARSPALTVAPAAGGVDTRQGDGQARRGAGGTRAEPRRGRAHAHRPRGRHAALALPALNEPGARHLSGARATAAAAGAARRLLVARCLRLGARALLGCRAVRGTGRPSESQDRAGALRWG